MLTAPAKYHNPARYADVIERAAAATYYSVSDITGPGRWPMLCEVRFAVMAALADHGLSTVAIGRLLNRDHSTTAKGIARAAELRANDADFARLCEVIQ